MTGQEFFAPIWQRLIGRIEGPLAPRVILQPTVAMIIAIYAGLRDAGESRPTLWLRFINSATRSELPGQLWRDVGKVFIIAMALDVTYELIVFRRVFPGQVLLVAILLAVVPYLVWRDPVYWIMRSHWRYSLLIGMQTIGAVQLILGVIPDLKQVLTDSSLFSARTGVLLWSLWSITLIQAGHWLSYRIPAPFAVRQGLLSDAVIFLGRIAFVFATAVFALVFLTEKPGFHMPVFWYVVTILGLFSLYCYGEDLERLGKRIAGQRDGE